MTLYLINFVLLFDLYLISLVTGARDKYLQEGKSQMPPKYAMEDRI